MSNSCNQCSSYPYNILEKKPTVHNFFVVLLFASQSAQILIYTHLQNIFFCSSINQEFIQDRRRQVFYQKYIYIRQKALSLLSKIYLHRACPQQTTYLMQYIGLNQKCLKRLKLQKKSNIQLEKIFFFLGSANSQVNSHQNSKFCNLEYDELKMQILQYLVLSMSLKSSEFASNRKILQRVCKFVHHWFMLKSPTN
eukprot:TRINITY_DN5750_c0_g2_i14.p4 TRINITY_DN5750_c0_g2~~TRINITY_DN5750_c0_g2_i14.p4  ORF type:complete len:196 (+),score=-21.71 TRINITY_DN5750_c0_g2_i14:1827-2414(+)